jgi:effector-binding domain-containing protein
MSDTEPFAVVVERDNADPTVAVRLQQLMAELDLGALFGEQLGRLFEYAQSNGLRAGPPYARYHEFGPENADIEIGLPLDEQVDDLAPVDPDADGEIGSSQLPAGRCAVAVHLGAYEELGRTYQALEEWIAANGHQPAGPPWESYLVLPPDVDNDPTRLRTEISWPIS